MGRNTKIDLKKFKELFYKKRFSNKEVADYFGVAISTITGYRIYMGLPKRGWGHDPYWKGKHHTLETKDKISKNRKGKTALSENPNWKGGGYLSHGYKMVRVSDGYMREHRYIMEKHLGRPLKKDEHIHHINHNKVDNRLENLVVVSNKDHGKIHVHKGELVGVNSKKYRHSIHK